MKDFKEVRNQIDLSEKSDLSREFQAMSTQIFDFQKKISGYQALAKKASMKDLQKNVSRVDEELDKIRKLIFDKRSGT